MRSIGRQHRHLPRPYVTVLLYQAGCRYINSAKHTWPCLFCSGCMAFRRNPPRKGLPWQDHGHVMAWPWPSHGQAMAWPSWTRAPYGEEQIFRKCTLEQKRRGTPLKRCATSVRSFSRRYRAEISAMCQKTKDSVFANSGKY